MVFALIIVCFLYAFGTDMSNRARLFVILVSPIVALVANVVRLVPTVWLYGYAEQKTAVLFHDVSGWAMMPLALFGLIGIGAIVRSAWESELARPSNAPL